MITALDTLYRKIVGTYSYTITYLNLHRKGSRGDLDIEPTNFMIDRKTANEYVESFFNGLESGYFWATVNGYSKEGMIWTGDIPEACDIWSYTFSELMKLHMDLEWQFIDQPRHETEDVSILQGLIGSALYVTLSVCSWRVRRQFYKVVEDSEDLFSGINEEYLRQSHHLSMNNYLE